MSGLSLGTCLSNLKSVSLKFLGRVPVPPQARLPSAPVALVHYVPHIFSPLRCYCWEAHFAALGFRNAYFKQEQEKDGGDDWQNDENLTHNICKRTETTAVLQLSDNERSHRPTVCQTATHWVQTEHCIAWQRRAVKRCHDAGEHCQHTLGVDTRVRLTSLAIPPSVDTYGSASDTWTVYVTAHELAATCNTHHSWNHVSLLLIHGL